MSGIVYLVGAGPGDPWLITCRGADLLRAAEVVIYDGLVNAALLDLTPAECQRIYAGKKRAPAGAALRQEQINDLLVAHGRAGKRVVRLKGGDPFVFGRGAEECAVLSRAGVPFEVVPGVSSAMAVTAYAGIPLTARSSSSTVAFATGHEAAGKPTSDVDWQGLARAGTVVLFMALRTTADCCARLIAAGRHSSTPAAAIHWGTTAAQKTVVSTLEDLAEAVDRAGLRPPTLLVIGDVVSRRSELSWFEKRPLFGTRVLITRRVEQSGSFSQAIAELGAEPVVMPVTRVVPASDRGPLTEALANLHAYDWVIFTSANAVVQFTSDLHAQRRDARAFANARIACVGPATAAELAKRGLFADVVPEHGNAERAAEAVIAASGAAIAGARVLVPRAQHGRDELIVALRDAGAIVDAVHIYTTVPAAADDHALAYGLARLRDGGIDAVAFFAPSQVRALFSIVGDAGETKALLGNCRVIAAIGNTTKALLEKHGVKVDVVPSRPDATVLAAEIAAQLVKETS